MTDASTAPRESPAQSDDWSPATRVVVSGRPAKEPDAALNHPVSFTSTYVAEGATEYGRYGNLTWTALEETLGDLEGGRCLSFASGMAAVSCVLDLVGQGMKVVAPRHAYNGSIMAMADLESRGRLTCRLVDITDLDEVVAEVEGAALVWLESPTNPALEVFDPAPIIAAAHEAGAYVVFDNTFATPLIQRPLEWDVDVVVHSATKYLAGHSDVQMGALLTRDDDLYAALQSRRNLTGAIPGPMEAWLTLRGMRTLALRVERAQATATELVRRLRARPEVVEVRYPGFGGIIGCVLASAEAGDWLTHSTKLWVHATSLGGVESMLERRRRWKAEPATIPDGLVRMSVGIEDVEDLWADLVQALDVVARETGS